MNSSFKILACLSVLCLSCDDEPNEIKFGEDTFSYLQIASYGDYFGGAQLVIFDITNNHQYVPPINLSSFEYQTIEAKIYFQDGTEILNFDPKNEETRSVFQLPDDFNAGFHVSPDKKFLTYSDYEDINLVNLETGDITNITQGIEGDFRNTKWSPNGQMVVVRNNISKKQESEDYTTSTANFKIYSLDDQSWQDVEMYSEFASPGRINWSPNSDALVYNQNSAVFMFSLKNNTLSRITSEEIVATNPTFSKDGKMITYYKSDLSQNGDNWQDHLTIYKLETETHHVLSELNSFGASWNDTSTKILYGAEDGIYLYDLSSETNQMILASRESIFYYLFHWLH